MTTSTTADLANVPQPAVVALPPKAVTADAWIPDGGRFYRVFEAEERHLGESIRVWAHGCQWDDGTVEKDGIDAPGISVDGVVYDRSLTSETARRLADLLVTAADELDGWAAK